MLILFLNSPLDCFLCNHPKNFIFCKNQFKSQQQQQKTKEKEIKEEEVKSENKSNILIQIQLLLHERNNLSKIIYIFFLFNF